MNAQVQTFFSRGLNINDKQQFFSLMRTKNTRMAWLGDPDKVDIRAKSTIVAVFSAIDGGFEVYDALHADQTRSPVSLNGALKRASDKITGAISIGKTQLIRLADEIATEGGNMCDQAIKYNEKDDWAYRFTADRMLKMAENKDKADLKEFIRGSEISAYAFNKLGPKPFGLSNDEWVDLWAEGMKSHCPQGYAKFDESNDLKKIANGYDKIANGINTHFYDSNLARQLETRVEI